MNEYTYNENIPEDARPILKNLAEALILRGLRIAVVDEEDYELLLEASSDVQAVLMETGYTDWVGWEITNPVGDYIGIYMLIMSNDEDVVSDIGGPELDLLDAIFQEIT